MSSGIGGAPPLVDRKEDKPARVNPCSAMTGAIAAGCGAYRRVVAFVARDPLKATTLYLAGYSALAGCSAVGVAAAPLSRMEPAQGAQGDHPAGESFVQPAARFPARPSGESKLAYEMPVLPPSAFEVVPPPPVPAGAPTSHAAQASVPLSAQAPCIELIRTLFEKGGCRHLLLLEHHPDPSNVEFQNALVQGLSGAGKPLKVYLESSPPEKFIRENMERDLRSSTQSKRTRALEVFVAQREASAVGQGGQERSAALNGQFVKTLSAEGVRVEFADLLDPQRDDAARWRKSGGVLVAGFAHGMVHVPKKDRMALRSEGIEGPLHASYRHLDENAQQKVFDFVRKSPAGTVICMQNEMWQRATPSRRREMDYLSKEGWVIAEVGLGREGWNATVIAKSDKEAFVGKFVSEHADIARVYQPAGKAGESKKEEL